MDPHVGCCEDRKFRIWHIYATSSLRKQMKDTSLFFVFETCVSRVFCSVCQLFSMCFAKKSTMFFSTCFCCFLSSVTAAYVNKNSECYVILLDATKAFDRVHFTKLFSLLYDRSMCPSVMKLLLHMYTQQTLSVQWKSHTSPSFSCTNGIKQGAVLSPLLFCVYADALIKELECAGVGCHIGQTFAGALSYADDLTLIAPCRSAAQCMLDTCEQFSANFDVKFNPSKTKLMLFLPNGRMSATCPPLSLFGSLLDVSKNEIHLGSMIGSNCESINVDSACNDLRQRTNLLMSRFSFCDFEIRVKLFRSYCCSFYGCPLFRLNSLNNLLVTWRKCIRRVCKLPPNTHCRFIPILLSTNDLKTQLLSRFAMFMLSCIRSTNPLIRLLTSENFICSSKSSVANNLRDLLAYLNINFSTFISQSTYCIKSKFVNYFSEEDHAICECIIELRNHLDGFMNIDLFNCIESYQLLYSLCST